MFRSGAAKRAKAEKLACTALLLLAVGLWLYPVFLTVITSLKTDVEVMTNPVGLPIDPTGEAYPRIWDLIHMGRLIRNSLIYAVAGTALAIVLALGPAYALSRFDVWGGNLVFVVLLIGMTVPQQTVAIPLFELLDKTNLINRPAGLILVHGIYGVPFVLLILRGYMAGIPKELEAAARVDGCDDIALLTRIIAPLTRQGLLIAFVLNVMNVWKELFFALIFLSDNDLYPVTLGLVEVTQPQTFSSWALPAAAVVISNVPIVIIYIVAYRWIQEGMFAGALKG